MRGNMNSKNKKTILNIDLVNIAQDTLISSLTTIFYGKETILTNISMEILMTWFKSQKRNHTKVKYGAIYTTTDIASDSIRIYQGLFDDNWNCLVARQVTSEKIDDDVKKML